MWRVLLTKALFGRYNLRPDYFQINRVIWELICQIISRLFLCNADIIATKHKPSLHVFLDSIHNSFPCSLAIHPTTKWHPKLQQDPLDPPNQVRTMEFLTLLLSKLTRLRQLALLLYLPLLLLPLVLLPNTKITTILLLKTTKPMRKKLQITLVLHGQMKC
jgi:hypothetical protein